MLEEGSTCGDLGSGEETLGGGGGGGGEEGGGDDGGGGGGGGGIEGGCAWSYGACGKGIY